MPNFIKEEVKNFEIVEEDIEERLAENKNSRVRCWVGTWNNPKMTDEEFLKYLQNLYENKLLQYGIFQREKGEDCGTIHFQFFIDFINAQYFKKVKELLPYGCHFKPMRSNAKRCQSYCSKDDTRVSGPFEVGEFEQEGQRSDSKNAIEMIDNGTPYFMIEEIFATLCIQYSRQLKERCIRYAENTYSTQCRNVENVYIYGKGGVGKTSKVYQEHGFKNVFSISLYEKYLFENYNFQNVIMFDEFDSQLKITDLNKYLDVYPVYLRGLGKTYPACYERVYIISNKAPSELYKDDKSVTVDQKQALYRRLHKIIYIDDNGKEHLQKNTIFKDLKDDEISLKGLTRIIDKVYTYDKSGIKKMTYSCEKEKQISITPFD